MVFCHTNSGKMSKILREASFMINLFTAIINISLNFFLKTKCTHANTHKDIHLYKSKQHLDLLQVDKIFDYRGGDGEIDHPVHEVEGEEGDGEHDPAVLVNITGPHA